SFFFSQYAAHPALHSFPTRRSSDLLPDDFDGVSYCADIHISPDGKYLYGSNRGHNSLVIFRILPDSGKLERIGFSSVHGDWPRRSEEHTSELQSRENLVCRLLLEKK